MNTKPNLVIFNPDQWRGDVMGHLGNPGAVTPRLDQFVKEDAVSFGRTFVQATVCTSSRCSFMTGWYPHVRGHRTMYHMVHDDEPNLLAQLKAAGYYIWWAGKNDLYPGGGAYEKYCDHLHRVDKPCVEFHGYKKWRGEPGSDNYYSFYGGKFGPDHPDYQPHPDARNVDAAAQFIQHHAPKDRPWCVFLTLTYPHPPYLVEDPWYSQVDVSKVPPRVPTPADWSKKPAMLKGIYDRQGLQGWTEDRWQELRRTYYGMCARVDAQFGQVIDALKQANAYDDAGVLFFSDHGDFTGDYGLVEKNQNTFEDCLSRVPLMVKPPKSRPVKPRVTMALTELIDFTATVYDIAGIDPDYTHFGKSLLPLIAGETDENRDAVFCEGGRRPGEEHCAERESGSSDDTAGLYWPRVGLQIDSEKHHNYAVMCRTDRYKYVRRLSELDELYDLDTDPGETDNRIDDPALADVRRQLELRMLDYFVQTADVVPHQTDKRGW